MANPGAGSNTGPLGIPPGGPWFVDGPSGTIQRQSNPVLAEGLAQGGWTGFPTEALAKNFASNDVAAQIKNPVRSAVGAVTSTSDFLSRLTSRNTWLRVLKVVAGIVLIIVGLAQLTHATRVIKDVGEAAALA
jgi:hypothetical protein